MATAAAMVALVAAGCGEEGPPPDPGGPPGAPSLVVQDDAELLYRSPERVARNLDLLERSGVRAVRITAGWRRIAPARDSRGRPQFDAADPAAYDQAAWSTLDLAVRMATDRGLVVMIDVAFGAPAWARSGDRPQDGVEAREFALFASAVARRYRGDFAPEGEAELPAVGTLTLWNEPNHPFFLAPQLGPGGRPASPHLYRQMVALAYPAVKAAAPATRVLIGGLAAHGRRDGVPPLRFLREMACVDAALRPLARAECRGFRRIPGDGFAHHPYSLRTRPHLLEPGASPDDVPIARLGQLSALVDQLVAAGRLAAGLRDLYLTEYAYETRPPDPGAPFGPARAARMWAWAEAIAATNPRVRTVAQFLVRDLPGGSGGQSVGALSNWQSGLLFLDGRPKPLAAVIPAPLHAQTAAGEGGVRVWGRVRRGSGPRPVRLEARRGAGAWRVVFEGVTDPNGVLARKVLVPADALLRITRREGDRWLPGAAVDVIRP
jgi:hypothetical protein